ncbi:urease accessory protein UreD [Phaeovulum sp.]|uniref:urease accessory protein UreD n=1 Tax=Phaeovulum sp. TaxID=2934796 RepID=UPI0035691563
MIQGAINTMERSKGAAYVRFGMRKGRVALADLAQSGSARAILPRSSSDRSEVVFLNTSGGLTSGDRLSFALALDDGASVVGTTQTAERAYLCREGAAHVQANFTVGGGGRLDWLPQETILFEDCFLERNTRIDLAAGASCLLCETVVLGRRAMGETPVRPRLRDKRMVTLSGRPLWADCQTLDAKVLSNADQPAMLGGNCAFGVLALLGAGAEAAVDAIRALPITQGVTAAASGWNGRTVVRIMAPDVWPLKQYLGQLIARMTNRPLPRVWQMQGITA